MQWGDSGRYTYLEELVREGHPTIDTHAAEPANEGRRGPSRSRASSITHSSAKEPRHMHARACTIFGIGCGHGRGDGMG